MLIGKPRTHKLIALLAAAMHYSTRRAKLQKEQVITLTQTLRANCEATPTKVKSHVSVVTDSAPDAD